jgi:hypothetical protein
LIGVQGYSGHVVATATAPSVLVCADKPTKNSRPVNKTSDPDRRADGDRGSMITFKQYYVTTSILTIFTISW